MSEKLYTLVLEFDGVCDCDGCEGGPVPDLVDFCDSPAEVGQALSDWCYVYAPSRFRAEVAASPYPTSSWQLSLRSTNRPGARRGGRRRQRHDRAGETVVPDC